MPAKRKKTVLLDPGLLEQARRSLGVKTETEAITRALEAVVRRQQHVAWIKELTRRGPFDRARID